MFLFANLHFFSLQIFGFIYLPYINTQSSRKLKKLHK
uniref:Uncharacterized protein n=1 Tax=Anguilla anguilla TaxID=7936 RepID=A0A0E9RS08_ANGAN